MQETLDARFLNIASTEIQWHFSLRGAFVVSQLAIN